MEIDLEKIKKMGVALLASRTTQLGKEPCGGSDRVFWEDVKILEENHIPFKIYTFDTFKNFVNKKVIKIKPKIKIYPFFTLWYCSEFLLKEKKSILLCYNEPMPAGISPKRSIIRFDWFTALPRWWKISFFLKRFKKANYLFPSKYMKTLFLKNYPLIPKSRTYVIYNSVDLNLFKPFSKNKNYLRIGFVGQWTKRKGLHFLLKAWEIIKSQIPQAELWIAGSPFLWARTSPVSDAEEIYELMKFYERKGMIKIKGEYPYERMPDFYNSINLLVIPSLEEPFGLTAIEAMACGVPIIASKIGGLKEIINENCGILVPPADSKKLATAIIKLLKDDVLREKLSKGALTHSKNFSYEFRKFKFLKLLEKIAKANLK